MHKTTDVICFVLLSKPFVLWMYVPGVVSKIKTDSTYQKCVLLHTRRANEFSHFQVGVKTVGTELV